MFFPGGGSTKVGKRCQPTSPLVIFLEANNDCLGLCEVSSTHFVWLSAEVLLVGFTYSGDSLYKLLAFWKSDGATSAAYSALPEISKIQLLVKDLEGKK